MIIRTFLACVLATSFVATASYAAYTSYNCTSSTCNWRYTQKPMGTREYRVQCNGTIPDIHRESSASKCTAGEKPMTCTITVGKNTGSNRYETCSCTNWSMTKKRDAKISVNCDG